MKFKFRRALVYISAIICVAILGAVYAISTSRNPSSSAGADPAAPPKEQSTRTTGSAFHNDAPSIDEERIENLRGTLPTKVQKYIDDTYRGEEFRSAAVRLTIAQMDALSKGSHSAKEAAEAFKQQDKATACILKLRGFDLSPGRDIDKNSKIIELTATESKKIMSFLIENREDMAAYLKYMANLSGQAFASPKGDVCAR